MESWPLVNKKGDPMLKSLLKLFFILIALVVASAVLPLASFWLVRDPLGRQLFFWLSPWTCAVWAVLVSVLIGSRFWLGREHVLAWRAARGGYMMSSLRSTALMFVALLASYAFEFAVILLLPRSPTSLRLLPLAAYAPAGIAALWSVSGGTWSRTDRIIEGRRLADSMNEEPE
jgi:hypothetical protein